ncbi:hypothetical protein LUZ60_003289 [Juncus effusus]|nr:hypothetical protein LUZ60_003289 [Juncus effusus]
MAKNGDRRRSRGRSTVLALLLASVFAPILLFTDSLSSFSSSNPNSEFNEEGLNLISRKELGKLSVKVIEDPTDTIIRRINEAHQHNLTNSLIESKGKNTLAKYEKSVGSSKEHKNRVLYATNEESQSENNNKIIEKSENEGKIIQVVQNPKIKEINTVNGFQNVKKITVIAQQENKEEKSTEEITTKFKPDNKNNNENKSDNLPDNSKNKNNDENKSDILPDNNKNNDENKSDNIPDKMVIQLRDQLIRARVYLKVGSSRSHPSFIRELKTNIKNIQQILGDSTKDSQLPKNAYERLKAMEETLKKGKQIESNCSDSIKKLRGILHSTEDQLNANKKQNMFLSQLNAKTIPKGLHCLPLRLTNEYFINGLDKKEFLGNENEEKFEDNNLFHYAIFSDNVLATAVVVNSTIFHAKDPEKHVFHIVTDKLNYFAMKMWFISNPPKNSTIQIQNYENFKWLNSSYSPVLKQLESQSMINFYFKNRASSNENLKYRNPKYLSILNHLRFYLPQLFPKLEKILFLDDDVAVQKDLSALWKLDLKGKVIGVVETCGASFHRFDKYLNFSNELISKNFDPHACGWAFGMNLFDLVEWKKQNITEIYHSWQKLNEKRLLWKLGTLPAGLVTFWNRDLVLEKSWHLLGLGYNPNINHTEIKQAAVIHYNGNLKPWLEISLPKYRNYWSKYLNFDQVYLQDCNISP